MGRWLQKQREYFKKNRLSEERTKKLQSLGLELDGKKRLLHKRTSKYPTLGEMPEDDNWYDGHEDGIKRRVPPRWEFPKGNLLETYILYHCHSDHMGNRISPMKMFRPADMANAIRGDRNLQECKMLCGLIDKECVDRGVVINGEMTEDVYALVGQD